MDRTEICEARFNWAAFKLSVIDFFYENQRADDAGKSDIKACSDRWCSQTDFREQMWKRVRSIWVGRSGCEWHEFPYSIDGVSEMYFQVKKRNKDALDSIYAELGGDNKDGPTKSMF